MRNARGQVDLFHGALSAIPRAIRSTFTTPGLAAARRGAQGLATDITHIHGRTVTIKYQADGRVLIQSRGATAIARARGGWISGPGGPTADMIPAMLSSGEYVVNARSASRHGALLEALNARHMAVGGPVGRRVTTRYVGSFPQNLVSNFIDRWAAGYGMTGGGGGQSLGLGGSGVTRWAPTILQALRILGQSTAWLNTVEARMNRESGGNPRAVNLWDSNALAGHPSVGLMQVIRGTFAGYAGRFRGTGPFLYGVSVNPLANTYAGLHYALGRYGSLAALARPGGYDKGGYLPPGLSLAYNGTGAPERVL